MGCAPRRYAAPPPSPCWPARFHRQPAGTIDIQCGAGSIRLPAAGHQRHQKHNRWRRAQGRLTGSAPAGQCRHCCLINRKGQLPLGLGTVNLRIGGGVDHNFGGVAIQNLVKAGGVREIEGVAANKASPFLRALPGTQRAGHDVQYPRHAFWSDLPKVARKSLERRLEIGKPRQDLILGRQSRLLAKQRPLYRQIRVFPDHPGLMPRCVERVDLVYHFGVRLERAKAMQEALA